MQMMNKALIFIAFFLLVFSTVQAWTPPSNGDFRDVYALYNVTNITAEVIFQSDEQVCTFSNGLCANTTNYTFYISSSDSSGVYEVFNKYSINITGGSGVSVTRINGTVEINASGSVDTQWNITGSEWLYNNSGVLEWNETLGNASYCTADNGLCTGSGSSQWNITGSEWLYNNSGILEWNESLGNASYCTADNGLCAGSADTQWDITGSEWLYNNSGILEWNESLGNASYCTATNGLCAGSADTHWDISTSKWMFNDSDILEWNETLGNESYRTIDSDVNWTFLQNYPAACPSGSWVSQNGDSNICTALTASDSYLTISSYDITANVSAFSSLITGISGWINTSYGIVTTLDVNMTASVEVATCVNGTDGGFICFNSTHTYLG